MCTFDEYCGFIESFIRKDLKSKKQLGFELHDLNSDGKICPIDVWMNMTVQMRGQHAYLLWFDIDHLFNLLQDKIAAIPEKDPEEFLPDFEKQFEVYWREK